MIIKGEVFKKPQKEQRTIQILSMDEASVLEKEFLEFLEKKNLFFSGNLVSSQDHNKINPRDSILNSIITK